MKQAKSKVKVGDYIRLSRTRKAFSRGFLPRWTEEVFVVTKVGTKEPVQINVKDLDEQEIEGSYYKEEVQVVSKPDEYRVENIVQERKVGGKKQYIIKWLGYPAHFNSWVGEDAIRRLDKNT